MSEFKAERAAFDAAMKSIGKAIKRSMSGNFVTWGKFTIAKFKLHVKKVFRARSGSLARSFSFVTTGKGNDTEGRFFSTSKYARIHEYGGKVRPVRRKFLAIPIEGSPAMTQAGVARYGFSLYDTLPKGYSFWFLGDRSGGVLMGRKKGSKKAKAQPWYALKKMVYVKPRLQMRRDIKNAIKALREQLAAGVNEAKRG